MMNAVYIISLYAERFKAKGFELCADIKLRQNFFSSAIQLFFVVVDDPDTATLSRSVTLSAIAGFNIHPG